MKTNKSPSCHFACAVFIMAACVVTVFAVSPSNTSASSSSASGGPVLLDKNKDDDAVYRIVYELNGGTQNQANVDFYSGNKDVPLASPTRSGYVFVGWWTNPNGTGKKIERISKGSTGEKKLYALWKMDGFVASLKNDSSMLVTAIPLGKVCRVDGLCNSEDVETLDAFAISKYEVTQSLYYTVMGKNPSKFASSPVPGDVQDQRPVESVSYDDAIEFCNALSELAGREKCYRRSVSKDGPGGGGGGATLPPVATDFPPKRNGSSQRGAGFPAAGTIRMPDRTAFTMWRGSTTTPKCGRIRWVGRRRTPWACTT